MKGKFVAAPFAGVAVVAVAVVVLHTICHHEVQQSVEDDGRSLNLARREVESDRLALSRQFACTMEAGYVCVELG